MVKIFSRSLITSLSFLLLIIIASIITNNYSNEITGAAVNLNLVHTYNLLSLIIGLILIIILILLYKKFK